MLIPGVSGGTVAVYLGIYNKIISSVAEIRENIKKNIFFLLLLLIGAALSVIMLSKPFDYIIERYGFLIRSIVGILFFVLTLIKIFYKNIFDLKRILLVSSGVLFPALLSSIPGNAIHINANNSFLIFIISVFLSIALILPGISYSYCLLLFGLYQKVLKAIYCFDIIFILNISIGTFIGILLFTKIINLIMIDHSDEFECCINGFVLFSSIQILPINYILSL